MNFIPFVKTNYNGILKSGNGSWPRYPVNVDKIEKIGFIKK